MQTIDQVLADKLNNWRVGDWPVGNLILCLIAMLLAIVLCGAIGLEREHRGRTAGLRTHLLVGVGSCMIMIISIYGFPSAYTRDVARLAAQVVTGVGFLGAGAIIHRNSATRGLTTAATIWIAMAIGLACGSMNFLLAIGGTLSILIVLILFRKVENGINKKSPLMVVRAKPSVPLTAELLKAAEKFSCSIHDLHVELEDNGNVEATFLLQASDKEFEVAQFVAHIEQIEDILHVEIVNSHKY